MQKNTKKTFARKRYCFFCKEERSGVVISPDYKNVTLLKKFITERGKIVPKNRSGLCAQHQRDLALAVKRARFLVLLPYSTQV
jgi:small subunit ribosomal protein S18